jgi:hypothetical protein
LRQVSSSPRSRSAFVALALALAAGLGALAGGCTTTVGLYADAQSDHLRDRPVLVVDSLPQPPMNEERQRTIIDAIETRIRQMPYIGPATTRQQYLELTQGDFTARNDYQTYVDTMSAVGISDRELARNLGRKAKVDLIFNAQAFYAPCAYCVDGDSAYLVAQFIEAASGRLLLRADLRLHPAHTDQALGEAFITMQQELYEMIEDTLTPKYQIERFRNLSRLHGNPDK